MKVLNHIGMFAAIALAFVGCSKEIEIQKPEDNSGTHTLTFKVEKTVDTRTSIVEGDEKSSYIWTDGDEANFNIFENNIKAKSTEVTFSDDFKTATVKATFQNTDATSFEYTAVFAKSLSNDNNPLVLNEQSPELNSFDPEVDVLVTAEPLVLDGNAKSDENTEFLFAFKRVVSVNKMTLKGMTPGEVITDVTITTDKNISARYKLADGSYTKNSETLVLKYNTKETVVGTVGDDGTFPVYFVAAPIEDASFTVRVATDQNVYERTLTSKLTFSVGKFRRFGISLEGYGEPVDDEVEYALVEEDDQIAAGGEYLFVSTETGGKKYVAASAFNSSNYYTTTSVTVAEDDVITITTEPVTVFTLEASSNEGKFYIKDSDGYYLYYNTGNTVHRSESKGDDAYLWTVTTDGINNVKTDARSLQFNRANPRFACYSTTQAPLSLYVNTKSLVPLTNPELSFDPEEVEVDWEDIEEFIAPELSNPYEVAVTYSSSDAEVATVSSTGEITFVGNGTTTITASSAKGNGYAAGSAQYTLIVTGAPVDYDFTTIAELNALVTTESAEYVGMLTDAVVSFAPANNSAIIKDATGSITYFKSGHGLVQGQTFSGELTVTAVMYSSKSGDDVFPLYSEITAFSDDVTFEGTGATVDPETITLTQLIGNYSDWQNAYVKLEGVTVVSQSGKNITVTDGENEYIVYDNTGNITVSANDVITAEGTVTKYKTTEELKVWSADDLTIDEHTAASHAITFTQPTAGGTFTVTVDGTAIASGDEVMEGKTVTLSATPAEGFSFVNWTVEGASVNNNTVAETTFTVGISDITVGATFVSSSITTTEEEVTGTFTSSNSTLTLTTTSGLTIVQGKGAGQNDPNATYNTPSTMRLYKGHTLTFTGKTIVKIEITVKGTHYGDHLSADCGTLTPTTTNGGTIIWEGNSDSVTITNNGSTGVTTQIRPAKIVVTYAD